MYQHRQRRIEIISQRLLRRRSPRLQIALILGLTGLCGFLTSVVLLQLGVTPMAIRYPIAIGVAYGFFLLFLALWLWLQRRGASLDLDLPVDFVGDIGKRDPIPFGGGGNFSGGGAGGSWGSQMSPTTRIEGGSSIGGSIDIGLDLDGLWWVVLALVALLGGLLATLYVIYIAPVLLAEILIDGALIAGLYRRVKHVQDRHWLRAAIRRTIVPATLAALFLTTAGFAMQKIAPEARSVGQVWHHIKRA